MTKKVIGILAHVDAGKTTLSEALLYKAGVIRNLGRVDKKDSFLDNNVMERERGITIFSKEARITVNDSSIVLIDTPGHVDFGAETERALNVLDAAILMINASNGVQSHTKTLWKLLRSHKIPTFIFVNKMDLPDTDKDLLLQGLKKDLNQYVVDFSDDTDEAFLEEVASSNEKLIEKYLETMEVSTEEIGEEIANCKVFPCLFGSALKMEGVDKLLEILDKYLRPSQFVDEFSHYVYKISTDSKGTKLTHLKCLGGGLRVKEMLGGEKVNDIRLYNGEGFESVQAVNAGDIYAVAGLNDSHPGKIYGKEVFMHASILEPVLSYSVFYPREVDTNKMLGILRELEKEEPGLQVTYDEEVRETKVCLMGEVQIEILTRLIKDRYGIDVTFGQGRINYKETIKDTVEGVGHFEPLRHYAEVHLLMEPSEPGSGLSFDTNVSTDELALNWQRLITTHLNERIHKGVLTGSPITDMKITLVSGRAHQKHTEGGDFRQATYRAVRQGLMQATNVLLEPVYDFTLEVPSDMVGRAMTDMDKLHATCEISENLDGRAVLIGRGPVATLNGYAKDLMAYTRGLGTISVAFGGYEPCHNLEEMLLKFRYDPVADLRNTPDSVFCAHGSSMIIPWDQVFDYMHLPLFEMKGLDETKKAVINDKADYKEKELFVTTEEIDAIINKTAYSNRKAVQTASKGISASLRERQRNNLNKRSNEPAELSEYKGTKHKEKYLLIDGYNVVHAWPELKDIASVDINGAAGRLMDIVSNYQGMTGYNTILVFDAYKVLGHKQEEFDYNNIHVVYTKTAETADHYIERYTHENGKKYDITVITSDGVEQVIIRGQGSTLMTSLEFKNHYERSLEILREQNNIL